MRKNRVILVAAAAGIAMALTACSSSVQTSGGGQSSGGMLLGIVSITANEAGNALFITSATKAAEQAGWKVEVVDAQGDAAKANAAMKEFVTKGAGMIMDLVFPPTSLGAGLAAAKQAHIPVGSWTGGTGDGIVVNTGNGGPIATIVTEALVRDLGGAGEVLALTYHGGQACIDREKGFDKVMAQSPNIKVTKVEVTIPGFLQDGAKDATSWLAARPAGSEPLAIWGCWDDPTLGAISALKQLGRTDVKTYGIVGSVTAIAAVKDGSMTATVYENVGVEATTMFETMQEAIAAGASWTPKTIDVPGQLIDSKTIDGFLASNPGILK
jgi:ribose transport system substrate-binding protein